jgi:hypothetical protein
VRGYGERVGMPDADTVNAKTKVPIVDPVGQPPQET